PERYHLLDPEAFLRRNLPRKDLAAETLLRHRPSLPAEEAVGARGQRADAGQGAQRLAALGGVDRDVVVAQAAHPCGQAAVPDHLQLAIDEAGFVRAALDLRLHLQPAAAVTADGIINRQAEPWRGGARPG